MLRVVSVRWTFSRPCTDRYVSADKGYADDMLGDALSGSLGQMIEIIE
jgi:hypothetical protein